MQNSGIYSLCLPHKPTMWMRLHRKPSSSTPSPRLRRSCIVGNTLQYVRHTNTIHHLCTDRRWHFSLFQSKWFFVSVARIAVFSLLDASTHTFRYDKCHNINVIFDCVCVCCTERKYVWRVCILEILNDSLECLNLQTLFFRIRIHTYMCRATHGRHASNTAKTALNNNCGIVTMDLMSVQFELPIFSRIRNLFYFPKCNAAWRDMAEHIRPTYPSTTGDTTEGMDSARNTEKKLTHICCEFLRGLYAVDKFIHESTCTRFNRNFRHNQFLHSSASRSHGRIGCAALPGSFYSDWFLFVFQRSYGLFCVKFCWALLSSHHTLQC